MRVSGGVELPQNETQIAQWLVKNGPIAIGLNAFAMQFYFGGVSYPFSFLCDPSGIILSYFEHHLPIFIMITFLFICFNLSFFCLTFPIQLLTIK